MLTSPSMSATCFARSRRRRSSSIRRRTAQFRSCTAVTWPTTSPAQDTSKSKQTKCSNGLPEGSPAKSRSSSPVHGRRHTSTDRSKLLFADIVDSTNRVVAMGDDAWRDLLSDFRSLVRTELDRYDGREVSTRGDDFFAVVGSPSVAVEIARAMKSAAATLGLRVRCGIHLGEGEHHGDDFTGIAVHIAARIVGVAQPDEILVSQTVRDALY